MTDIFKKRGHGGDLRASSLKFDIEKKDIIDFSSNINPLGLPEKTRDIFIESFGDIDKYPDPYSTELRYEIARYLSISPDSIICGNGSDELFFNLFKAIKPKKTLIVSPTYSEYETALGTTCDDISYYFLKEEKGFVLDIQDLKENIDTKTDMIIICNPNNPTGKIIQKKDLVDLVSLCEKEKILLVIDEAFMDFLGKDLSIVDIAGSSDILIVFRSMTKIFSIPGLRLGYVISNSKVLKQIARHQQTWPVNSIAQSLGVYLLKQNDFLLKTKQYVSRQKDILYDELKNTGFLKVYRPSVNFILARIKDKYFTVGDLAVQAAKRSNILIRDCSNFRGLDEYYFRIAVKSIKDNKRLVRCLGKIRFK